MSVSANFSYNRLSPALHIPFSQKNPETEELEKGICEVAEQLAKKELDICYLELLFFKKGEKLFPLEEWALNQAQESRYVLITEMKNLSEKKEDLLLKMDPDLFYKMSEKSLTIAHFRSQQGQIENICLLRHLLKIEKNALDRRGKELTIQEIRKAISAFNQH